MMRPRRMSRKGGICFSREVKAELAHIFPERACCRRAELGALLWGEGGSTEAGGWRMKMESAAEARLILRLIRTQHPVEIEWGVKEKRRLGKGKIYEIQMQPQDRISDFLADLGIRLKRQGFVHLPPLSRLCCRRAYLRGAFLACGSVNHPRGSYHLEWAVPRRSPAERLLGVVHRFFEDARMTSRAGRYVIYVKRAESIAGCLSLMGATQALLRFEEVRALKETKNEVQRRVNCETANLERLARASTRQIQKIRTLKREVGLKVLPEGLRRIARLRLRYPEASLLELGKLFEPPLSRSSVSHRLSCLEELADRVFGR